MMVEFKERIKHIRTNILQLTQEEFGAFIGKSRSTVAMYEAGQREPESSKDYIYMARVIGCTIDYLMGVSEDIKGSGVISEETKKKIIKDFLDKQIKDYFK